MDLCIKQIKDFVKSVFFSEASVSHDWDHTMRVLSLCQQIAKSEGGDPNILSLAALLHDISRKEEDECKGVLCHAELGAKKAKEVLGFFQIDEKTIKHVVLCIASHRYRKGQEPESLEAKILFDADKLDAIGAIGIGRAFVFSGEIGARVHNKDVDITQAKAYTVEDTAYVEYMVKLSKIKDKMLTPTGQKMALNRHQFMNNFFKQLNQEVAGLC